MAKRRPRSKTTEVDDGVGSIVDSMKAQLDKELGHSIETAEAGFVSWGSLALNRALGGGGCPLGRLTEIYGGESSGKTTVATHVLANAQAIGGIAALLETEGAHDPVYARQLGLDTDRLVLRQPDCIEEVFDTIKSMIDAWEKDCEALDEPVPLVIVWDSVAATPPKAELEGEFSDDQIALAARRISKSLRMIVSKIKNRPVALVFVNQTREKIGVMFGSKISTYGGKAIKFHATHRISLRTVERRKNKAGDVTAIAVEAKVDKNKLAPPFRRARFDIVFGEGVCPATEILNLAEQYDIVKMRGAWVVYGEERLGQGRDNAVAALRDNEEWLEKLRADVVAAIEEERGG